MEQIQPIKPSELNIDDDLDLNKAIDYINIRLKSRELHYQIHKVENYNAIILSPCGEYIDVMDRVVEKFKSKGWDCKWASAYDARGPHYCFYVHEKHFI